MSAPAGWFPQEDGRSRYWDGQQWTDQFAPGESTPRPWFKKKRFILPGIALALIVLGSAVNAAARPGLAPLAPLPVATSPAVGGAPAPAVGGAPEASEAPEATEAPGANEGPEATEAPGAAEAPEATEGPEAKEAPEAAQAPEASEGPEATEAPDGQ